MPNDYKSFIDKVIWGILGTIGLIGIRFLDDLNTKVHILTLEVSKMNSKLEYHEAQLRMLGAYNESIFRVETELGMHEKRLLMLERKLR